MGTRVLRTGILVAGAIASALVMVNGVFADTKETVKRCIDDIRNEPSVFYSQEASTYFTSHGGGYGGIVDKDGAMKTFRACIRLASLGSQASDAIPLLLEKFPRGIHVRQNFSARYNGEGTLDDWVNTHVMSAKNEFMLSSPFLDYNSMSQCEQYIQASYSTDIVEQSQKERWAIVNVYVTLTFNAGACALANITGQDLGPTPDAWRQWWAVNQYSFNPASVPRPAVDNVPQPAGVSKVSFDDVVVGAKYRMSLNTGDDLIGIVESKTDSSLILETTDGKPYSFKPSLVARFDLLEMLRKEVKPQAASPADYKEARTLTYSELREKPLPDVKLEVQIKGGTVFKGSLMSIDDEMMKINVDGSSIPISRDVVERISTIPTVPPQPKTDEVASQKQPAGPMDTVKVRNPQTDDYGRPKPDFMYAGYITGEDDKGVTIKTAGGEVKKIDRNQITRIIRHSSDSSGDGEIKRYAKALYCPQGMILVDMPFGKPGRPFFKVCIDKYEYPNKSGVVPQGSVSYGDAQNYCTQQGKRLCTAEEWRWACSGLEGYAYPYGWNVDKDKCNTDSRQVEPSGNRTNCVSKFGAFDMAGNVFEWVTNGSSAAVMGGPFSKCQTISPGGRGEAKPQTGFRCCKSN